MLVAIRDGGGARYVEPVSREREVEKVKDDIRTARGKVAEGWRIVTGIGLAIFGAGLAIPGLTGIMAGIVAVSGSATALVGVLACHRAEQALDSIDSEEIDAILAQPREGDRLDLFVSAESEWSDPMAEEPF